MRKICAFCAILGLTFVLGCASEKPPTPGQQLDKAIEKSGEAMQKAGEEIKKAGEEVKKEAQK